MIDADSRLGLKESSEKSPPSAAITQPMPGLGSSYARWMRLRIQSSMPNHFAPSRWALRLPDGGLQPCGNVNCVNPRRLRRLTSTHAEAVAQLTPSYPASQSHLHPEGSGWEEVHPGPVVFPPGVPPFVPSHWMVPATPALPSMHVKKAARRGGDGEGEGVVGAT